MHKKIIAAALVAPIIALAPASAWAHHCKSPRHHHARNAETGKFGTSKSMNKSRSGSQMNQGTGAGSSGTDQGATGGSTGSSGKSGGGI